jgi:TRAP-type C4-dicarboxylate transport system substrate-binding protein
MNLDKYNALSPEKKKWLDAAGAKTEIESQAAFKKLIAAEYDFLKSKGMKETQMNADDAQNIEKYWNDGLWTIARATSGAAAQEIYNLIEKTGMSNLNTGFAEQSK